MPLLRPDPLVTFLVTQNRIPNPAVACRTLHDMPATTTPPLRAHLLPSVFVHPSAAALASLHWGSMPSMLRGPGTASSQPRNAFHRESQDSRPHCIWVCAQVLPYQSGLSSPACLQWVPHTHTQHLTFFVPFSHSLYLHIPCFHSTWFIFFITCFSAELKYKLHESQAFRSFVHFCHHNT